ncbi:hypothetical protein [Brevibacillus reuszeri]|uniref:hypothetical protein n=1 Tax=Brevibacillus reuszeri TaxID=54915 RepID=UPI000CCC32D9|nr:hypothetical protein [Brevibacillus reuszeri]
MLILENFEITRWTGAITEDGKIKRIKPEDYSNPDMPHEFRLLDDDDNIYGYGFSRSCDDEDAFAPLDHYGPLYGCTEIQYYNRDKMKWETL